MQAPQSSDSRRHRQFFWLGLSHESLFDYYRMNFALIQHHKWGLSDLEEMMPWEREIYVSLLIQYLDEKRRKEEALNMQTGISHG